MERRAPVVATPFALRGLALGPLASVHQCESAEEWAVFLNSESARRFALNEVPAEVAFAFLARPVCRRAPEILIGDPRA